MYPAQNNWLGIFFDATREPDTNPASSVSDNPTPGLFLLTRRDHFAPLIKFAQVKKKQYQGNSFICFFDEKMEYIKNPVRAELMTDSKDYLYTSACDYAGEKGCRGEKQIADLLLRGAPDSSRQICTSALNKVVASQEKLVIKWLSISVALI